jgi:hypothetical protein
MTSSNPLLTNLECIFRVMSFIPCIGAAGLNCPKDLLYSTQQKSPPSTANKNSSIDYYLQDHLKFPRHITLSMVCYNWREVVTEYSGAFLPMQALMLSKTKGFVILERLLFIAARKGFLWMVETLIRAGVKKETTIECTYKDDDFSTLTMLGAGIVFTHACPLHVALLYYDYEFVDSNPYTVPRKKIPVKDKEGRIVPPNSPLTLPPPTFFRQRFTQDFFNSVEEEDAHLQSLAKTSVSREEKDEVIQVLISPEITRVTKEIPKKRSKAPVRPFSSTTAEGETPKHNIPSATAQLKRQRKAHMELVYFAIDKGITNYRWGSRGDVKSWKAGYRDRITCFELAVETANYKAFRIMLELYRKEFLQNATEVTPHHKIESIIFRRKILDKAIVFCGSNKMKERMVLDLLEESFDYANQKEVSDDDDDDSHLFVNLSVLRYSLAQKEDGMNGHTPLSNACRERNADIVQRLIRLEELLAQKAKLRAEKEAVAAAATSTATAAFPQPQQPVRGKDDPYFHAKVTCCLFRDSKFSMFPLHFALISANPFKTDDLPSKFVASDHRRQSLFSWSSFAYFHFYNPLHPAVLALRAENEKRNQNEQLITQQIIDTCRVLIHEGYVRWFDNKTNRMFSNLDDESNEEILKDFWIPGFLTAPASSIAPFISSQVDFVSLPPKHLTANGTREHKGNPSTFNSWGNSVYDKPLPFLISLCTTLFQVPFRGCFRYGDVQLPAIILQRENQTKLLDFFFGEEMNQLVMSRVRQTSSPSSSFFELVETTIWKNNILHELIFHFPECGVNEKAKFVESVKRLLELFKNVKRNSSSSGEQSLFDFTVKEQTHSLNQNVLTLAEKFSWGGDEIFKMLLASL